jgi:hypothetical protein
VEEDEMVEDPKPQRWWSTLPGILTALAALITAMTGLVAALYQTGVLGSKAKPAVEISQSAPKGSPAEPSQSLPQKPSEGTEASTGTQASSPSSPATRLKPWSEAMAVITAIDDSTTTVRAETLSYVISVVHAFEFRSGQSIDFEKMRSFAILSVDDPNAPHAKATISVTLLDGRMVTGDIQAGYGYDIAGYNELGRFQITLQHLKRVEFQR